MAKLPAKPKSKGKTRPPDGDAPDVTGAVAPEQSADTPDHAAIAALQDGLRAFAGSPRHARLLGFLRRLAETPPQVLLLEGGTADERLAAVHFWMLLLNCPDGGSLPCLECPQCVRMLTHLHRDCFFFDGLAGSIKIDDVRELRPVLGESPREARYRMVVFREAQALVEAAANALLKSFEEPRPGTSFVLLAPQRERLLPTLVSRSVTLTLPWPEADAVEQPDSLRQWEQALCSFLRTGQDFLDRTATRGAVDAPLAHALTNLCRRALVGRLKGQRSGDLQRLLHDVPETRLRILDEAIAESQESLNLGVNPTLVLEWLATRLYFLLPRGGR
jgi:DNA polymerase-3 subunit delta'